MDVREGYKISFCISCRVQIWYLVGWKVFWDTKTCVESTNAAIVSEDEVESNCAKDRRIDSCMTALGSTHMPQITYYPLSPIAHPSV
jgi:hypothetical protein